MESLTDPALNLHALDDIDDVYYGNNILVLQEDGSLPQEEFYAWWEQELGVGTQTFDNIFNAMLDSADLDEAILNIIEAIANGNFPSTPALSLLETDELASSGSISEEEFYTWWNTYLPATDGELDVYEFIEEAFADVFGSLTEEIGDARYEAEAVMMLAQLEELRVEYHDTDEFMEAIAYIADNLYVNDILLRNLISDLEEFLAENYDSSAPTPMDMLGLQQLNLHEQAYGNVDYTLNWASHDDMFGGYGSFGSGSSHSSSSYSWSSSSGSGYTTTDEAYIPP